MRAFKFIFTAIVAVIIVILSVANGGDVTVKLWPDMGDYGLPASPVIETKMFLVGVICGFFGFIVGLIRWLLHDAGSLMAGRRDRKEAEALRKKVEELTHTDDDIPAPAR